MLGNARDPESLGGEFKVVAMDNAEYIRMEVKRFLRFLVVGVVNTAFGYSVYAGLLYVGLHYSVAAFFGTILGVLFNFKTTGTFVFKNRENRLIFRYVTVYAVLYLVNVGILKVLNMTGMNMYLAGALPIPLLAMLAYFMQKTFVFNA